MPTEPNQEKARFLISVEGTEADVEQLVQYSVAEGIGLKRLLLNEITLNNGGLDDYVQMADYFAHKVTERGQFFDLC